VGPEPLAGRRRDLAGERGGVPLSIHGPGFLVRCVAISLLAVTAHADGKHVEHEPIPPDPANDLAFGLRLDGDLPPAIETASGLVSAPDPRASLPPVAPGAPPTSLAGYDNGPTATERFTPDTDTARPDTLPYSDPFVPSTAPWKRLVAFDAVDADYSLGVLDTARRPLSIHGAARPDPTEERFYGDLVVDLHAEGPTRIPSVGPGARVDHARLGNGSRDVAFTLLADGAENWFVQSPEPGRARLVLELSISRSAFGGPFDAAIEAPAPGARGLLPPNVQRDADVVAATIGVPKATRRETLTALVEYFRSFTESSEPPSTERGVYLALALSKKGVCRHRAYAFMVTATGLGFPTRVVLNEAHAWVEVQDGRRWKRIDLGGAGTILAEETPARGPAYAPPPDPFNWPAGARRGEDLGRTALGVNGGGTGTAAETATTVPGDAGGPMTAATKTEETRVDAVVTLETDEATIVRGQPVHLHGSIRADGSPCTHLVVAISARERKTGVAHPLGELATDEHGDYVGGLLVPKSVGVGDYELVAVTSGDARCGKGTSP
jgi:hypothetical protein